MVSPLFFGSEQLESFLWSNVGRPRASPQARERSHIHCEKILKKVLGKVWDTEALARISHRVKRIGAPNQRKLFCENDFLMIRGEPRCRQSVSRIFLDLKPSKAAR
jgi:hypothetical protein